MKNIPTMKSINECASIVGLAKYYVRQLVLQNKVKYVMAGKKYLINLQSLLDYLNNGEKAEAERKETAENKTRKVGM